MIETKKTHQGLHKPGACMIVERGELKVGSVCTLLGRQYPTLTAARKAAKSGEAIVKDGIVVSVK